MSFLFLKKWLLTWILIAIIATDIRAVDLRMKRKLFKDRFHSRDQT